jgi:hypothetical protein
MLVRTTTARVARDSYMDTLVSNGDDLAVIQNADGTACDICQAWDGVIMSISGANTDYPSYNQALNAGWGHPNCRCTAERIDETIDKTQIEKQAEAETPSFERQRDETDSAYRSRITPNVANYSREFWPAAGREAAGGADAAAAAASKAAAEAAEAARKAAEKAAAEAARKAAEAAAAEAARKAEEAAEQASRERVAARLAAAKEARLAAERAAAQAQPLLQADEIAKFKTAIKTNMQKVGLHESLEKAIDDVPDAVWARIKGTKPLKIVTDDIARQKTSGAYYESLSRSVRMNKSHTHWSGSPSTFKHELGHDVHYTTKAITDCSIDPTLAKAMEDDLANWKIRTEKRLGKAGLRERYKPTASRHRMLEDVLQEHGLQTTQAIGDDHRVSSMSDTIGGLSKRKFGNGHSMKYYKRQNNGAMEAYANIFRGLTSGWNEYERAFPLTTGWIKTSLGL